MLLPTWIRRLAAMALALLLIPAAGCGRAEKAKPDELPMTELPPAPGAPGSVSELFDRLSKNSGPENGSRAAALVRAAEPVGETGRTESASDISASEGSGGLGAMRLLPAVSEEVPDVRIGWWINDALDAFQSAVSKGRTLVLFLGEDGCEACAHQIQHALRCPEVERFAGDAVFGYSFVSNDFGAKVLRDTLGISDYPTATILEPDVVSINERARIRGDTDAERTGASLHLVLWTAKSRADGPFTGIPALVGAPATADEAARGTASRGLTHKAPLPICTGG